MSEVTYITRGQVAQKDGSQKWKYSTAEPEGITARFREVHRKTGTISGLGNIVEHAGWDKSTVIVRYKTYADAKRTQVVSRSARGTPGGRPDWLRFKLLDRHKFIRILDPADKVTIATIDGVIADKARELESLRTRRAEAVEQAWQRGAKIDIELLEEKANAPR